MLFTGFVFLYKGILTFPLSICYNLRERMVTKGMRTFNYTAVYKETDRQGWR